MRGTPAGIHDGRQARTRGQQQARRRDRRHTHLLWAAVWVALLVVVVACDERPPGVAATLTEACREAAARLASAPAPGDPGAEAAFLQAAHQATRAVAKVAAELAPRGDDRTIADLAWQLHHFPRARRADDMLAVAQEAAAAIIRIDHLARRLDVPACGAPTWRPSDWRTMAAHHGDRMGDTAYQRELDRLCAATFPTPALLSDGMPLLHALAAGRRGRAAPSEAVPSRLLARLNPTARRPSAVARFVRDFSNALPRIRPPTATEDQHLALIAAFLHLDAALPAAVPQDPPPDMVDRVSAALDDLQSAWHALGITC